MWPALRLASAEAAIETPPAASFPPPTCPPPAPCWKPPCRRRWQGAKDETGILSFLFPSIWMSCHGIIVLDKPRGMSSFQAARAVGRALGERRAGHGGTLDPAASGVLPICLGEATKLAFFLQAGDKEYEAEIEFGVATDTL